MSYENQAGLKASDPFRARVDACATEQALVFKDDARPDIKALANAQLSSGMAASGLLPFICSSPGFGDVTDQSAITDGQLLSAVQTHWPTYAALVFPA